MKADAQKAEMFRDWVNNFLTVDCFADYYGISRGEAETAIEEGRIIHHESLGQFISPVVLSTLP